MNSNLITKTVSLSLLLLASTLQTSQAGGGDYSARAHRTVESVASLGQLPKPSESELMKQVFEAARNDLIQVETLLQNGEYAKALNESKRILDDVRIKSGINPKTVFREKIIAKGSGLESSFNLIGQKFNDLSIDGKDDISVALSKYKFGYFLDILNQIKRANLMYIQATLGVLRTKNEQLMDEDIEKFVNDIVDVISIPIYIKPERMDTYFLIFDHEVANSDQHYFFNRELKQFLMLNKNILKIANYDEIAKRVKFREEKIREEYQRSYRKELQKMEPQKTKFDRCVEKLTEFLGSSSDSANLKFQRRLDAMSYCHL
jgi:hypothetical protein